MLVDLEIIKGLSFGFEFISDEYFDYLLIDLFFIRLQFSSERV